MRRAGAKIVCIPSVVVIAIVAIVVEVVAVAFARGNRMILQQGLGDFKRRRKE